MRDWGVLCVCMCVCEKSAETKEAAAAFNVPVVCPSPKPQAETTSPPPSLSLWPFFYATHGGDEEEIPERGNRLRYSLEVEDSEGKSFPSLGPGVPPPSSSPLPNTHYYTSSGAARRGAVLGLEI